MVRFRGPTPIVPAILVGAILLLSASCSGKPTLARDVQYCSNGSAETVMDIYPPTTRTDKAGPAVVYIHGGSWRSGDKADADSSYWRKPVADELRKRGYLVAAVNYRLAPEYPWPAQLEDVACAIQFLRVNASAYHLDPTRIGAWGTSSGGQLAALLGVMSTASVFSGVTAAGTSAPYVPAVVTMGATMDLTATDQLPQLRKAIQEEFWTADTLQEVSPVSYASEGDAKFLILHGEEDDLVSVKQATTFASQLQAADVDARAVIVENADHQLRPVGGVISPDRNDIVQMITDFFDESLGAGEGAPPSTPGR